MLNQADIELAAEAFAAVTEATARDLAADDVAGEEDFSGQFIGRLKAEIEHLKTPNTRWRVAAAITEGDDGPAITSVRFSGRQLQSKGSDSEESWSGADLLFVLEIKTPMYEARKGVLVQAKRLEVGKSLGSAEARRLRAQCGDMLNISSSSYVFLYSTHGVRIASATTVEGSQHNAFHELVRYRESIFFQDFLMCWIGDPRLKATDREALAVIRALARARNALLVQASAEGTERQR